MTRIHAIDLLKFLVATGVVWAHAVLLGGHITMPNYLFGQGLVRNAVPTFALISGFLFHATHRKGNTARWLAVLIAAYLFWCAVYAPFWLPDIASAGALLAQVAVGPLHLWYMAALVLAVAVLTIIVSLSPDTRSGHRRLALAAVGALLCGSALQSLDFFTAVDVPLNGYRNGLFVEFPYAALGYLVAARLRERGLETLPRARVLWLILAGLALLRLGEATLSLHLAGLSPVAPPEFPPLAAGFSLVLFLAMLRTPIPRPALPLGYLSISVYFLHYLVLLGALYLGWANLWVMLALGLVVPVLAALALLRVLRMIRPEQALARPVSHR